MCTSMCVQACLGDNSMSVYIDFLTFNSYMYFTVCITLVT